MVRLKNMICTRRCTIDNIRDLIFFNIFKIFKETIDNSTSALTDMEKMYTILFLLQYVCQIANNYHQIQFNLTKLWIFSHFTYIFFYEASRDGSKPHRLDWLGFLFFSCYVRVFFFAKQPAMAHRLSKLVKFFP